MNCGQASVSYTVIMSVALIIFVVNCGQASVSYTKHRRAHT